MRVKLRKKVINRGGRKQITYEITIPRALAESVFNGVEYFELRVETREGKPVIILEPVE